MNERPAVLRNTERKLWSEAIGHCMNPDCQTELIENDANTGDMAHIIPNSKGGNVCFNNLILLCKKCHTQIDYNRTKDTIEQLQEWKNNRNSEIEARFVKRYTSFKCLKKSVTPIIERNRQIFDSYGPLNYEPYIGDRHKMWLKFEHEIISNNRRLQLTFEANKRLIHKGNRPLIDEFIAHAREFVETRDHNIQRFLLFPQDFLSVFGIGQTEHNKGLVSNVSALQNLIADLMRNDKFVDLDLENYRILRYRENNEIITLDLTNQPHINQIYYSGMYYSRRLQRSVSKI